jgi:hypothetical protein
VAEAFGTVLWVVVAVGVIASVASLFGRGRLYEQIGRGMFSIRDEVGPAHAPSPTSAAGLAIRDDEIRQLLEARNVRRRRRGQAELDVESELRRLTVPAHASDPALVREVRDLVIARNARRARQGKPPLDVEAEIARQLAALEG